MTERVLTGITTSGTPHLGNYVGAIRPAIAASRQPGVESFLFLADYHALIKCDDPARIGIGRQGLAGIAVDDCEVEQVTGMGRRGEAGSEQCGAKQGTHDASPWVV